MDSVIEALVVKRTYPHPQDLIFRAWTEPVRLERWFCPNPKNKVKAQIDLRVGGAYRIAMIAPTGDSWVVGGTYQEIDRPQKLVFTWKWENEDSETSLVTVHFRETADGTEVEVTHDRLASEESRDNHGQGWIATMDRLYGYLADPMETQVLPNTDLFTVAIEIRQAKELAKLGLDRVQRTFNHVPQDKLHWTPSETSKSALRILVHTALSNQYFASVLRGDEIPHLTAQEAVQKIFAQEPGVTSLPEAQALYTASVQEVLDTYETLDPTRVATDPKVAFVLLLVGRHADGHASQIDYLQTTWGDLEDHFVK